MSRLSDEVGAFLEASAVSEDDHGARVGSPLDVSNAVLERANRRLDRLEARLADLLEPILDRAAAQAAASFRRVTASALPLTAAATPGVTNLSTMVCVKPTAEQASALAQDGGIDPADLHVTLCYLGEIDGTLEPIAEALRPVAAEHAPLQGVVGGVGVFAPNEEGVGPAILLPDVPGLVELRVAVSEALAGAEIDYGRDHGFEAHVTVRYYSPGDEAAFADLPFLEPLSFGALYLVRGDVVEYELPLVGRPPVTAAAGDPPGWMPPTGDELVDVEALVRQLRTKTDPVRRALVEQAMTPTLKTAGLDFDVTNPFVERVLGQTGQHVRGIADTTRVNVMRIIRSSAEQGLTVPDTAAAIRQGMRDATAGRARTIARTELAGAVNGGSLAATKIVAQALGTEYMKRWLTAAGAPHPRHEEYDGLDGQTVGLDENFDVGGSPLEFPGDPGGEPGETINCRCTLVYLEGKGGGDGGEGGDGGDGFDGMTAQVPPPGDDVSVGPAPFVSPAGLQKIDELGLAEWPPKMDALAQQVFGSATDTVGLYKRTGEWDADRKALHDSIVAAHFEGKVASASTKRAYFTAGGGASGKSSAVFRVGGKDVSLKELAARPDTVAIDPDRIKTMLPEYARLRDAGDPYAASGVHEESSEIAKRIQQEALDRGLSVLIDTTGSSSTFVAKLEAAKAAGYDVKVSMFSIPTNEAIMRSLARGDRSGRYVSLGTLKKAHAGASRELGIWKDSKAVERWQVWDNSGSAPRLVAEGRAGETRVYDQQAFDAILAKANE